MHRSSEPLRISFTMSPDTVRSLFDLVASAAGNSTGSINEKRRTDSSGQASFGRGEILEDMHLMVSRSQASELLQLSTRTIDNLKRDGLMPEPIRIGRAVRWNRAELVAWVDAGCPQCSEWQYVSTKTGKQ